METPESVATESPIPQPARVEYPISPRYIPQWGVPEALRELITNALDTEAGVELTHDGTL